MGEKTDMGFEFTFNGQMICSVMPKISQTFTCLDLQANMEKFNAMKACGVVQNPKGKNLRQQIVSHKK